MNHFTGKERDTESGLDYFGARYYASTMGRWLSPDWSAKEEPVPYAKLDNPQSLNLYAYLENDPLGSSDPDGHAGAGAIGCSGPKCAPRSQREGTPTEKRVAVGLALGIGAVLGADEIAAAGRGAWALGGRVAMSACLGLSVLGTQAAQNLMSSRDSESSSLEAIKDAAASGEISLSGPTASRLGSAMNAVTNSFTNSDINGAIKQSVTGIEAGGDHIQELGATANSLAKLSKSLTGALQNPNLSDSARSLDTNAVNAIKPAVDQINKLNH